MKTSWERSVARDGEEIFVCFIIKLLAVKHDEVSINLSVSIYEIVFVYCQAACGWRACNKSIYLKQ
jgi:hypothetical protein